MSYLGKRLAPLVGALALLCGVGALLALAATKAPASISGGCWNKPVLPPWCQPPGTNS